MIFGHARSRINISSRGTQGGPLPAPAPDHHRETWPAPGRRPTRAGRICGEDHSGTRLETTLPRLAVDHRDCLELAPDASERLRRLTIAIVGHRYVGAASGPKCPHRRVIGIRAVLMLTQRGFTMPRHTLFFCLFFALALPNAVSAQDKKPRPKLPNIL